MVMSNTRGLQKQALARTPSLRPQLLKTCVNHTKMLTLNFRYNLGSTTQSFIASVILLVVVEFIKRFY